MKTPQIVRGAPSPTGLMHIGTARTLYYNYLEAKSTGGKFILRIDDTDVERNKEEYTQVIFDSLDWLGLEPNEVHYQSKRMEIYSKVARRLLEAGKAFIATSSRAIILKPPTWLPRSFYDTIANDILITDTNLHQIDGTNGQLVLVRSNGQPTYQFCSVVDDYEMGITNIIRGKDHISNTPKQIAIWQAIREEWWEVGAQIPNDFPQFTHLGLIFKDKKKLSKRDGAASLLWYKEQGYKPEAVLNWMLLLGWALKVPPGAGKEAQKAANQPISKAQAIEVFQQGTLKNSDCGFDIAKLYWLNKRY